jgi:hypothetical protein
VKEEKAMFSKPYAIRAAWHKKTSFRNEGGKKAAARKMDT